MDSQGMAVRLSTPLLLRLLAEAERRGFESVEDFIRQLLALADVAPMLAELVEEVRLLREEVARLERRLEELAAARPAAAPPPPPAAAGALPEALAELVEGNPWLSVIASRGSAEGLSPGARG